MGKVISLVNQKGGVGKTTTSINLSSSLGHLGKKVLLIDLDSQSNTTTGLGIERTNIKLAGAEVEIMQISYQDRDYIMTEQLKKQIDTVRDRYDYIIIDCPPALGILTTNALAASDSVLIPIQCEYYSLEGVNLLLKTILQVQKKVNSHLEIEGVLLTMLDGRTLLGLEVVEDVRKFFNEKVFSTIIPRLVKLVEAPSHGKPIIEYDPKSKGALAYLNLAKEVIERNGNK